VTKNKLYALHAPAFECISIWKIRTPYEFGMEMGIATTYQAALGDVLHAVM